MNDKKQPVLDQAVAALGGLVGGAALGTFAGPQGAALGGATGSVGALLAAKFAPEYFKNSVLHKYLNNRSILALLKGKLSSDLKYSFMDCKGVFDQAMESARTMLRLANTQAPSIGTLGSRLHHHFRWNLSVGEQLFSQHISLLAEYCRANGPIRVGCPAICCAPVAILRDLHARFADSVGLQLKVSCDE